MRLSGPKGFSPTPEQEAALRRFRSGASFKLVAVAGSGKTSTLRYLAQESLRESLLYLAFNRAVREEAEIRFPRNTYVKTLHGFAHDHVVKGNRAYEQKVRRSDGKVSIADVQERLDPEDPVLAYVLRETLERFIRSTDPWPQPHHLPREWAQRKQVAEELIENILDGVWELWQAMVDENDPFPLSHDGYVRLWRERGAGDRPPSVDAVLVDEAQDLDPNFQAILQAWKGKVQLVLVGDPRQQIYAWRGAVNAMAGVNLPESQLSWSFRFGEGLARFVREVTSRQSQGPVGVVGKANWPTEVNSARPSYPFTVLTRTNLGLLEALLELGQDLPRGKAHVVGGVKEVVQLLEDLADLKEGVPRRHPHPDLLIVESWKEAWELAQVNPFLKGLLKLARKYPDLRGLADRVKAMHAFEEEGVSLVLSTAHKAKGREWDRVLLWRDFLWKGAGRWLRGEGPPAKVSPELQEEENLFYVAITRAKEHLSLEKLSGNVEEEEEDLSPALIFPLKTKVSSPSSHEGQKVVSLPPEEAPLGLQTMAEADGAWDFILRYLRDRDGSIRSDLTYMRLLE